MTQFNNILIGDLCLMLSPKAANSAVKAAVRRALGESDAPDGLHKGWRYVGPDEVPKNALCVAVVRDPLARALSCWWQKLHKGGASSLPAEGFDLGMSWHTFVMRICAIPDERANVHFRSQYFGIQGRADHVIKVETPNWWDLVRELAADHIELGEIEPARNASNPPVDVVTEQHRRKLLARYADDYREFGYLERKKRAKRAKKAKK